MDKYLSVITNFGCHYTCPYCIVKNNHLNIPKTTVDGLKELPKAYAENGCNWISVSGGGDPLWKFKEHFIWWWKFWTKLPTGAKTELHTSIFPHLDGSVVDALRYGGFDRVVYHAHTIDDLKKVKRFGEDQIVRVVYVVDQNFTEEMISEIADICQESEEIDELSFRQMVDDHYQATDYCQDFLRQGHKKRWWYIEQCDYNIYYCENKVYDEYRKIGESDDLD